MSTQDKFLTENIGKKIHVYTVEGYHIWGELLSFDNFTILIAHPFLTKREQLIYKSGIVALENSVTVVEK
jgi:RNA chaperone Hfq